MFDVPAPKIPTTSGEAFPVRRIFCVGKNYAEHTREMGGDPKDTPPVFFTKPADAACTEGTIPFPPATDDLHYEGELVVALAGGGNDLSFDQAARAIYGYAAGCDLTRRDLQAEAKASGGPWDLAKALDRGAMLGPLVPMPGEVLDRGALVLTVNGEKRQDGDLSDMIWSIPELLAKLSRYFELRSGDLVFTGTPAGVGPLAKGDSVEVRIADLPPLRFTLAG